LLARLVCFLGVTNTILMRGERGWEGKKRVERAGSCELFYGNRKGGEGGEEGSSVQAALPSASFSNLISAGGGGKIVSASAFLSFLRGGEGRDETAFRYKWLKNTTKRFFEG